MSRVWPAPSLSSSPEDDLCATFPFTGPQISNDQFTGAEGLFDDLLKLLARRILTEQIVNSEAQAGDL